MDQALQKLKSAIDTEVAAGRWPGTHLVNLSISYGTGQLQTVVNSALQKEDDALWQQAKSIAATLTQKHFAPRANPSGGCGGDSGIGIANVVFIPDGAMEWLLHEVGHWLAATPEERLLPNYGLGQEERGLGVEREWQAWAFEEIVLAPFGRARDLTPPTQRDGVGFGKNGPIEDRYLRHIDRRIEDLGKAFDLECWRKIYGDWYRWGLSRGRGAPWLSLA